MSVFQLQPADERTQLEASSLVFSLNGSVISSCLRCTWWYLIWLRGDSPNLWSGWEVAWMGLRRCIFRPIRLSRDWSPGPLTPSGVRMLPTDVLSQRWSCAHVLSPYSSMLPCFMLSHFMLVLETVLLVVTCWTTEQSYLAEFLCALGVNSPFFVCHHDSTLSEPEGACFLLIFWSFHLQCRWLLMPRYLAQANLIQLAGGKLKTADLWEVSSNSWVIYWEFYLLVTKERW